MKTAKIQLIIRLANKILSKVKKQNFIYDNQHKDLLMTLSRIILYKPKLDISKINLISLRLIKKMITHTQFFSIENVRLD